LGEGTLIGHLTPVDVVGLSSGVTAITAGAFHTCAIVSGSARCWGDNYHGELGDGTTTDRYTPVDVVGLEQGVTAIAAGSDSTCALVSGGVKCWGLNDNGQIGDGTTTNRHTPADVAGLEQGATAVAAGFRHTCALVTGGGARCWGLNGAGQLGNGTTTSSNTPVDVFGLSQGVTAIAPGFQHTCAIYSGAVLCWGNYENGALGDGTITTHSIPFDVTELGSSIDAIAVGLEHTCVLVSGGVRCRGVNYDGQLGDGTMNDSSTLVSVIGLEQGVSAIAAGSAHTCALVSGGVKCWGYNYSGQLGDGTITSSSTPVDVVGLSSGVNAITARGEHTCALVSGGVQCWGYNLYGQLGDGTNTDSNTPVEVVGLSSGVSAVAAGDFHTCALVPGGGVQCWGYNYFGELGDGTNTDSNTPVDVVGLDTGVTVVSPGSAHTCALVSGGVKCWGQNQAGALGDGTNTDSNTPVDVIGLDSDATSVFAGGYHTCALVAGGGLKCWGDNLYGQLGDGTFTSSSTPENVAGMAQGVSAVVAGYLNNCALVGAGRAKCWGLTTYGWLGLGWRSQRLTPGYVVESLHPMLAVNYSIGQAGSFFTITGWNFPPSTQGSLSINDQAITNTLAVNPTCSFIFFLDSTGAEHGGYAVTVSVNPGDALSRPAGSQVQAESDTASTGFFLANAAPLRLQEGGGLVFSIPSGMALHNFVYLPVLVR
jgi:alpha-tubulin suppressor-like RCC1 family protein